MALRPDERDSFAQSVLKVQRASGAARSVARMLLSRLGYGQPSILRSESGMPLWPAGIVGSLAHDSEVAVAAVAMQHDYVSVGIDVEPATPLDADLLPVIATVRERERIGDNLVRARLLFCVKEAVYKASYPVDRLFLDHHDVEVDFDLGSAVTCSGRLVHFRTNTAARLVALAFMPAAERPEPPRFLDDCARSALSSC